MKPLVIIRPEPGATRTALLAESMGLAVHSFPLFAIQPLPWDLPERDAFDAVLLGSVNAIRHGGKAMAELVGTPAYAVGETTARAAQAAGLDVVATGKGQLQPVLNGVAPAHRRLLRLCGRERVPLVPPAGVQLIERICYVSEPLPIPPRLAALLAQPAIVALHSAEAARHFAAQCTSAGLDRHRIGIASMTERIAAAAGQGWQASIVAERAEDAALLALAARMCQNAR